MLQVTRYLGYSSLKDFFPTMDIKPNPGCPNPLCRQLQAAHTARYNSAEAIAERAAAAAAAAQAAAKEVAVHEENDWGIEVVAEPSTGPGAEGPEVADRESGSASAQLSEGLQYSMPVRLWLILMPWQLSLYVLRMWRRMVHRWCYMSNTQSNYWRVVRWQHLDMIVKESSVLLTMHE